jgi:DivIVA domain-containing protein
MATVKLVLDSNKILHKEFEGTKPGYDALQVDSFLDIGRHQSEYGRIVLVSGLDDCRQVAIPV